MADVTFECPQCGQRLASDEAGAGFTVPCPKCGRQLVIPQVPASTMPRVHRTKTSSLLNRLRPGLIAGIVLAVCVPALVLLVVGRKQIGEREAKPSAASPGRMALQEEANTFPGNPEAQYRLARALIGDGLRSLNPPTTQDPFSNYTDQVISKGLTSLKEAARQGVVNAQWDLSNVYCFGVSGHVPKRRGKALDWCERAAEAGHESAQQQLAYQYYHGRDFLGVPRDLAKAAKWRLRLAERGDREAQYDLAGMYFRGEGVPLDADVGMRWLKTAAIQGYARAQCRLGRLYAEGGDKRLGLAIEKDYSGAHDWLQKAALQDGAPGSSLAQLSLASMYSRKAHDRLRRASSARMVGGDERVSGYSAGVELLAAIYWRSQAIKNFTSEGVGVLALLWSDYETFSDRLLSWTIWGEIACPQAEEFAAWFISAAESGDPKAMHIAAAMCLLA